MLIAHAIVAALALAVLVLAPRSSSAALFVAVAAGIDVALGAAAAPAIAVVAPLVAFLTAALTLAALVERSGLADRAACVLAASARGSALALYVLVCALCGLLTAAISLDGAVVLIVPLLLVLARRFGAPLAPLFAGAVVVANAASIAVPQGNPTNLVVMSRLGLSPAAFAAHMVVPGLAATAICAAGVALTERRALTVRVQAPARPPAPPTPPDPHPTRRAAGGGSARAGGGGPGCPERWPRWRCACGPDASARAVARRH